MMIILYWSQCDDIELTAIKQWNFCFFVCFYSQHIIYVIDIMAVCPIDQYHKSHNAPSRCIVGFVRLVNCLITTEASLGQ